MKKKNVLLMMLPFWDPLVPPQGIAHLKNYLRHYGYSVKTMDANIEERFKEIYSKYFSKLQQYIPQERRGNFFNIGHDVMRNHMLAHVFQKDEDGYCRLVEDIVYQTYFTRLSNGRVAALNEVLRQFYELLEGYVGEALSVYKPDVFGLSVPRDSVGPSVFAFHLAKRMDPSLLTVMGGSIFSDHLLPGTPNFDYFLERAPFIDHVVIGEGQILLKRLLEGEFDASRRVLGKQDLAGERIGFSPLNQPDLTDFDVPEDYPYQSAQGSASCPFQCSFCNVAAFFGEYRQKEAAQTVDEMEALFKQNGLQLFFMNDSMMNHIADDLARELIDRKLSLYWDGYLRVGPEVCDSDTTYFWRKGGFYRARMGVESGSQHVLDMMGKGITPEMSLDALAGLAGQGIKTTAYMVIGHPGETEEDFQQTLQFMADAKDNIFEAECNPFIFGYSGQSATDTWARRRKLLFGEEARDTLVLQSWTYDGEPSREEVYRRVCRFVDHCDQLGIPNTYSLYDIHRADNRWQKLHANAVPPVLDFKDTRSVINENLGIKKVCLLENTIEDHGDFGF